MDFGTLLHTAQKNEQSGKKEVRYYSTKFAPPKKEQRNKSLSVNIKNFLAKKEAEEVQKAEEAKRKKEELLALRAQDKKATRRVNVMLKRTKSANQSVIQDAVDKDNTAVTLAGPSQPDEDDYGYVSQEAAAFYNKMMEKYSKMPDEPKFSLEKKKKVNTNLSQLKNKVIAALDREQEEANMPHRQKRKHKDEDGSDNNSGRPVEENHREEPPPKPKVKAAPPPLNFADLLKIAEKKQFEPIIIEPKEKKEEERPLTKKQKKELEREKEWRERKEGKIPPNRPPQEKAVVGAGRIPKLNGNSVEKVAKPVENDLSNRVPKLNGVKSVLSAKTNGAINKTANGVSASNSYNDATNKHNMLSKHSGASEKMRSDYPKQSADRNNVMKRQETQASRPQYPSKPTDRQNGYASSKPAATNPLQKPPANKQTVVSKYSDKIRSLPPQEGKPKKPSSDDLRPKQFPPRDLKPKQFPRADLKPKQFPPPDVKRKQFPPKDVKRKPVKRRILDDDDEEYDSEMDDFIDDGPEESEDYSKYISEIFGYDKSKYRHVDDDDDNMESSFSQQLKEEYISTKIGIMEDLEDIRKEEEEKRRKALMKKRKLK